MEGVRGKKAMLRMYCRIVCLDHTEWIVTCAKHVAYLARYAPGLGANSCGVPVEQWGISRILAYVKMTASIVEIENKAGNPKSK